MLKIIMEINTVSSKEKDHTLKNQQDMLGQA